MPDEEMIERHIELGPWTVLLHWSNQHTAGPVEISIRARDGVDTADIVRGITSNVLRSIPLTRLTEELCEERRTSTSPASDCRTTDLAAEIRTSIQESPRPGRKGRTDRFYAIVAVLYTWHIDRLHADPVRKVAELCDATWTAAANWVRIARQKNLLSESTGGQPGGELTRKAASILEAADCKGDLADGLRP